MDGNTDLDEPRFVPIDGKTLRGSGGASHRENPLHLLGYPTRHGVLGQVDVDSKIERDHGDSQALRNAGIEGSPDQHRRDGLPEGSAKQIVDGGGDYVLAVKDNQPQLHEAVSRFFLQRHENGDFQEYGCRHHQTTERSRRVEIRNTDLPRVSAACLDEGTLSEMERARLR